MLPARHYFFWLALLGPLVLGGESLAAQTAADYETEIKPLLTARCLACHGALKQEGSLRLDTVALMRRGGDSGPAIRTPNDPTSLLVERVSATDESERMPPEGEPLSTTQIQMLVDWLEAGAPAPENEQAEANPWQHWSFQPLQRPLLPTTKSPGLPQSPVDAFIEQALANQGLVAQPLASKSVLLRRVYLDLIGMPPTPAELHDFLEDHSPQAYERVVDRLLNDPRHGERWGRHWMDVWRYSDWYGRRGVPDVWNSAPQIWRWRDWIVRSVNEDKGYDRMVSEMLAADEICPEDTSAVVATGYLVRNWYALNPNDWMRNTVEHTGKAFLGLTFNCAHCHDHKYDPISQLDYFRLRAYFEPMYVRQDRVPGQADPGPFQDYEYSALRTVQRLGMVRVFDQNPSAETWFYTGGDERNRDTDRGPVAPGIPAFLAADVPAIQPIELPPRAWYPGLSPALQETELNEAHARIRTAEAAAAEMQNGPGEVSEAAREALARAQTELKTALKAVEDSPHLLPLAGEQSLVLDATQGRRMIHHRLNDLRTFDDGFKIEFELRLDLDAHFNFQLAKDVDQGLTAGYVGFEQGRVLSYQPGTVTEFELGHYRLPEQNRFHIELILQTAADRCLLTVKSIADDQVLASAIPVALNGWNPVGDPAKGILFDARPGSAAVVDNVRLSIPAQAAEAASEQTDVLTTFDFEPPQFAEDSDVVGQQGWEATSYCLPPATSLIRHRLLDAAIGKLQQQVRSAQLVVDLPQLKQQAAAAMVTAAHAQLASIEARIAADRAKYGKTSQDAFGTLAQAAKRAERNAELLEQQADVLSKEVALALALLRPNDDAERGQAVETASLALATSQQQLQRVRDVVAQASDETYTPFSPTYPATSTGRRAALASWITHPANPLTARVAVNHIWLRHFHAPLVASVFDFGRNGTEPTHPELLDWLALEFIESGWSMQHLHRLIVTSAAYQRVSSSAGAASNVAADPENTLLWRMNAGRMEAEVVRDSLLAVAQQLENRMGGQELENSDSLTTRRRSLYYSVHPEHGGKSPFGELFDGPEALECYRRSRSILPQQALALTNSELVHRLSAALVAQRQDGTGHAGETDGEFVSAMFERILTRQPTVAESQICLEALRDFQQLAEANESKEPNRSARESLVRALLNHNDFVTIR